MWRVLGAIVLGAGLCSAGLLSASADDQKTHIEGGIEGKVKSVDVQDKTLTIITAQGAQHTYTVTDETVMVGPRGGKVRRRLRDPRFQEGMSVRIVVAGKTASEIHLGYDREPADAKPEAKSTGQDTDAGAKTGTARPARQASKDEPAPAGSRPDRTATKQDASAAAKTSAGGKEASKAEADEEDNEVPGKIKRFDPERRILVVTLLNGKDRSFLLSKDVKVIVKGVHSKHGLEEPALKSGAAIEVVTDEGGHKVKELKVVPASDSKRRKAG
jgi:hypothetical protein